MVKPNYISLVKQLNTGKLPEMDSAWLNEICQKYPCFHGAHLLKGIYLKQTDEAKFEEKLPHIASRVNNRAVLYDRVHESYGVKAKLKETSQTTLEEDSVLPEVGDDLKSLVQSIRSNRKVKGAKVKREAKPKNIESAVNKNVSKKTKESSAVNKKKADAKTKTSSKKQKKEVVQDDTPASFTDWLKNQKPIEESKVEVPIDLTMSNEAELILEAKRSSYKLEDFLVNQIQRKQNKKEGAKPGNTHAVSETYAKILVSQGKIEEAIMIYKELSIKYPNKSSIFARQIELLKSN